MGSAVAVARIVISGGGKGANRLREDAPDEDNGERAEGLMVTVSFGRRVRRFP